MIVALVVVGLNISNESINQLTGETHKAVIALNVDDDIVYLELLGEEYKYVPESVGPAVQSLWEYLDTIRDYLLRIWRIFDTVFL